MLVCSAHTATRVLFLYAAMERMPQYNAGSVTLSIFVQIKRVRSIGLTTTTADANLFDNKTDSYRKKTRN